MCLQGSRDNRTWALLRYDGSILSQEDETAPAKKEREEGGEGKGNALSWFGSTTRMQAQSKTLVLQ